MKSLALIFLATAALFSAPGVKSANVGPAGYTNDFSVRPSAADWATATRLGSSPDTYDPTTDVNSLVTATGVVVQVTLSNIDPPDQVGTATWSSTGLYLQTRPTGNRYTVLMAKFRNNTETNVSEIALSYRFTIAVGGTPEDA